MLKNLMGSYRGVVLLVAIFFPMVTVISCVVPQKKAKPQYNIYGGPSNGSFAVFAAGISELANNAGIALNDTKSGGSDENIRLVNNDRFGVAIAYGSHVYTAINGLIGQDRKKYTNLRVLGYLYGGSAQLYVNKASGITSAFQLEGKKVNVGKPGSGSYLMAKIYFSQLKIWDKIDQKNMGYMEATEAFINEDLDACWLFTGYPSGAAIRASEKRPIDLLQLYDDGLKAKLFKNHPYLSNVIIPSGMYQNIQHETRTFQDSALLIANKDVPNDAVYQLLNVVYSNNGIAYLTSLKKHAKSMKDNDGSYAICTPLHPGAVKYYKK